MHITFESCSVLIRILGYVSICYYVSWSPYAIGLKGASFHRTTSELTGEKISSTYNRNKYSGFWNGITTRSYPSL